MGVAWTGTDDQFQGFIDEHGLTFPQISDDAGQVFDYFDVPYQPALVLIRPDGTTETLLGAADDEIIDSIIGDAVA